MRRWRIASVMALLVLSSEADGQNRQGWTRLPNGEWGVQVSYVTSGFFSCGNGVHKRCLAQGNTLSLTSFGSVLTLTYEPVPPTTFIAPSKPGQHNVVSLGRITKSVTPMDPSLTPKGRPTRNFSFDVTLAYTTPFGGTTARTIGHLHLRPDGTFKPWGGRGAIEGGKVAFGNISRDAWAYDDYEPVELTATATVNPEPVSMLLVGTGLLAIGGVVRRRRRA